MSWGCDQTRKLEAENRRLRRWVDDCQSGMFINCVYCGHRYGPRDTTPATLKEAKGFPSMQEALKAHIERCPKHPMSELKAENKTLRKALLRICRTYGKGAPHLLDNAVCSAMNLVWEEP